VLTFPPFDSDKRQFQETEKYAAESMKGRYSKTHAREERGSVCGYYIEISGLIAREGVEEQIQATENSHEISLYPRQAVVYRRYVFPTRWMDIKKQQSADQISPD
jgi:hypothetical protein